MRKAPGRCPKQVDICPCTDALLAAITCVVYIFSQVHSAEGEAGAGGSAVDLSPAKCRWKLLTATRGFSCICWVRALAWVT